MHKHWDAEVQGPEHDGAYFKTPTGEAGEVGKPRSIQQKSVYPRETLRGGLTAAFSRESALQ